MTRVKRQSILETVLNEQNGERGISAYLKENSDLLYWMLCAPGGHCRFVFYEFPLGSQFRADFVILNSYSGRWDIKFIELEPVDDKILTKKGKPSDRLATAYSQVESWKSYFRNHRAEVQSELARWAKTKDILGYSDGNRPCNRSGQCLSDMNVPLIANFYIIIGRRNELNYEHQLVKSGFVENRIAEVISYDRLLDVARERNNYHTPLKASNHSLF